MAAHGAPAARPRRVAFLVFDGMKMLDVTGPAEVLAEANRLGADYRLGYASVSGEPVVTSIGTRFPVDGASGALDDLDTLVVSGGDVLVDRPIPDDLVAAVRDLGPRARRLVSICTGSFILAAAGLLDGRRATTHWRHARVLAKVHPRVDVDPDALYVEDGGVFTSAGVSSGIDLALALVERDHGADLARDVARSLVMFMHRPGGQTQFSAPLAVKVPRTPELREAIDTVLAEPEREYTVPALAAMVGVSPRHLARLFAAELDMTPARFVEQVRLDRAKSLLDRGHSVTDAAVASGFGSPETMRRTFVARIGVSPSQYRARFATTR